MHGAGQWQKRRVRVSCCTTSMWTLRHARKISGSGSLTLCKELQLKGRIRVARDGINCTVGHAAFLHVPLKGAPSSQLVI